MVRPTQNARIALIVGLIVLAGIAAIIYWDPSHLELHWHINSSH